jgi:hypothetical protein
MGVLAVESEDGPSDGVTGAVGKPAGEFDEGVGVADGGCYFNEQKAKGSEVNANAQGEYEECSEDEGRGFAKEAEGVTEILKEAVDPSPTPDFAGGLKVTEGASEGGVSAAVRFGFGKVRIHFLGEFAFGPAAVQEPANSAVEFGHRDAPFRRI